MPKIISYNVNGIRAAMRKGLDQWLKVVDADIVCLQEIKAKEEQIEISVFNDLGYECFWHSAQKPGYSGTAILSRIKPDHVEYGTGMEAYDHEGRIIRVDYGDISVISVYMPSGSSGDERQGFKMQFLSDFQNYIEELRKERPKLIISGDYNICHQAIDIHNPQRNQNTSGFLPEERAWISDFISSGFVDTFRHFNSEPHNYSWWSYRANARAKNLGWRIDYHMATTSLEKKLKRAAILPEAKHSDHCPILLEVDF
tara:strand:+ start:5705 stop:6472 length:768 start_codon:yes stop_codon:yes gene_type:complete